MANMTINRTDLENSAKELEFVDLVAALGPWWRKLILISLTSGLLGYGVAWLIPPTYTARATFFSPQQQGPATAALASLGALSGLSGASLGVKNSIDQYVALMQSNSISQRIVDRFELAKVYDLALRVDILKELRENVRIGAGKKDGLITVEVDDKTPQRAADIANAYVEELRTLSNRLALTEAQQRRSFFDQQLSQTRTALTQAQLRLQQTGFNSSALRSEPKASAEVYAKLKAEIAAAEVRLSALRKRLADGAPEVQQAAGALATMRTQLNRLEVPATAGDAADYVGAYREFKYQEALFDVYARQFELARADEAREGALLQVVDVALAPERRSKPSRSLIAVGSALAGLILAASVIMLRFALRRHQEVQPS